MRERINFSFPFFEKCKNVSTTLFLPPFFFSLLCKDLVKQSTIRQIRYGSPETCFCCDPNKPCLRESFKLKWKNQVLFFLNWRRWLKSETSLFVCSLMQEYYRERKSSRLWSWTLEGSAWPSRYKKKAWSNSPKS